MTREDAIHFANCLKNNYTIDLNDMQAFCDEAIKALEQEPKTGHRVSGDLLGGLYCSECMTCLKDYFKYCPNCGAKMESGE